MKNNLLQITLLAVLFTLYGSFWTGKYDSLSEFQPAFPEFPEFLDADPHWVDSIMNTLSLEERIAQMIMVQAYSNLGVEHENDMVRLIDRYQVGGVIFFQGEPLRQVRMTNHFQEQSRIPLLIAIDGETGLGMRLENTILYPPMMSLGAIQDNSQIYQMGRDIAVQMKRAGIHMNFAPVADINNNPANPVINIRSFGEDRENVATKVIALMRGMQDGGLLVTAKHFPGHGDTGSDSHHSLPVINHRRGRLDSLELYPFREAIMRGLSGVMVAHINVPSLDPGENRATSVSRPVVTGLLRGELDFQGLVVTDALNMKGLSQFFEPGEREVEAARAGNDILLMPSDVGKAISSIKRAVRKGEIAEEQINESCRRILQAKYWAGLNAYEPAKRDSLLADINNPVFLKHRRKLVEQSLTLAKNRDSVLPLKYLEGLKIATVTIGKEPPNEEYHPADLYLEGSHFTLSTTADKQTRSELQSELRRFNTIIIHLLNTSSYASRRYGIEDETVDFIENLDSTATLVLNLAGYPYCLTRFQRLDHLDAIIFSWNDDPLNLSLATQAIFGGISITGRLPVSAGDHAKSGTGISTGKPIRLGYGEPLDVGLDGETLLKMDKIIEAAIDQKAMPGCQLLVARKGKVVWHKAYGYHTYQKRKPVKLTDIYDLASITKIASTMAALMRLRDQGEFYEDSLLGSYEPVPDSCNKADLRVSDVLTHQSGMVSWIPFHYYTMEPLDTSQSLISSKWSHTYPLKIGDGAYANRNVKYRDNTYQDYYSPGFPYHVADDLYLRKDFQDSILQWIYNSELISPDYRYSDLGFYIFHQIIEALTDTLLYPYVWHNFYAPLGATTLGYKPLNRFSRERIIPTENDMFYRRQLVQGHVHDMGAAMMGGVSGNAGLFSNSNDLAKMMQMYLNGGWYGERRYIDSTTLAIFTSCYNNEEENRRGLGFDRPITGEPGAGPACDDASSVSFGHSGFTGTIAWVDPDYDLVYIFLSNRIHPNQGNNQMIDLNVRTAIQQVIYDALEE